MKEKWDTWIDNKDWDKLNGISEFNWWRIESGPFWPTVPLLYETSQIKEFKHYHWIISGIFHIFGAVNNIWHMDIFGAVRPVIGTVDHNGNTTLGYVDQWVIPYETCHPKDWTTSIMQINSTQPSGPKWPKIQSSITPDSPIQIPHNFHHYKNLSSVFKIT